MSATLAAGFLGYQAVKGLVDAALSAGLFGEPGTLLVTECRSGGGRRSPQICTGAFTYASTGEQVMVKAFSWAESSAIYPAQINADGDRAVLRGVLGVAASLPYFWFLVALGSGGLWIWYLDELVGRLAAAVCLVAAAGFMVGLFAMAAS
ncbi:hypothetical protein ACFQ08_01640 [Streptosporangium algeriense]|uniref:Uncharacterized protein n=1 Tax=Streptosporangium algeriense TaxID=1682748 RepID=A0ABW3DKU8_9ACTN